MLSDFPGTTTLGTFAATEEADGDAAGAVAVRTLFAILVATSADVFPLVFDFHDFAAMRTGVGHS